MSMRRVSREETVVRRLENQAMDLGVSSQSGVWRTSWVRVCSSSGEGWGSGLGGWLGSGLVRTGREKNILMVGLLGSVWVFEMWFMYLGWLLM